MKKLLFLAMALVTLSTHAYDTCWDQGRVAGDKYFHENQHKQLKLKKTSPGYRDAVIRNACFSMVDTAIILSTVGTCDNTPLNETIYKGLTVQELIDISNIDCFGSDDIRHIENMLIKTDNQMYSMFAPNIDLIVQQISDGSPEPGIIRNN